MKMQGLFKNIRVADFSWMGVGSTTTKYLAEYGAQIIKIESRSRPDPMRSLTPFKDGIRSLDGSHLFGDLNINKYSIAINLSTTKGLELAKCIVAVSDIVSASFSAGTMEKMGLGYEDLKKVKPDIIMVSTNLPGNGGPFSALAGGGTTGASMGGFNHITGWPDRQPSLLGIPYSDFVAPLFNAAVLHAAIDYRQRTGKGQYFDMSQNECAMQFFTPLFLDYVFNHRIAQRTGNYSPYSAPHGVYRCAGDDRWCAIAVETDEQWASFCQVIGKSELIKNRKFSTLTRRLKNHEELDKIVETWTIEQSPEEVMEKLQSVGVPAGLVENGVDVWNDPQLRYYPAYCELDHPVMGQHAGLRRGPELSKMAFEMRRCPILAEHNEFVCKELLKMSDQEFQDLLSEGVIEQA